ncbi:MULTISPECIES: FAD-dependent monooxygenase [unclassified Streptomyces]|uniref:FAD-dependent monooxygenase n=1 Tax=unclassified Streptomyces TaxID=2593676 RepID=UPI000360D5F5|nr:MULTISPECIES: FAD-dependent monooxygenase [unclassified Streptomyces]MYT33818.1 monooxygenase [Streptomyces sp. SID8354]
MTPRAVLISGAGIAGPTLAYWLARHGFRPTVVEHAQGLRSSGSPVDVRGPAVSAAEQMGIMPQLRAAGTEVTELCFVDDSGRRVGRIPMQTMGDSVELPRFDLATILFEAAREEAEFLFGDSIATLHQDAGGVDVTFEHAPPRRFDLVIGADGLHSRTRRLTFGPESAYVQHLGVWVATMPVDDLGLDRHKVLLHNAPGRAVALHPGRGKAMAAFMYRGPGDEGFDHRNTADHKRRLIAAYIGAGWHVPELLQRVGDVDDLYFDSVSQVRLDRWSIGRVALLGDAASCVSLFGAGSTLAMAGASTLAEALAATPADHEGAFRRYEREHRRLVAPKQRAVRQATALLIPTSRFSIAARNAATRLWPLASGVQPIRRALRRRRATSPDQEVPK